MGIVQRDAIRTTIVSVLGLALGYINRFYLAIMLFTSDQVGLINLLTTVSLLFAQLANLGTIYASWRFFPFFRNEEKKHYGFLMLNVLLVCIGIILFTILAFVFDQPIIGHYKESPLFEEYYFWIIPIGIAEVFYLLFESYMRGLFENVLPVFLQDIVLRVLIFILLVLTKFGVLDFNSFFILHALAFFVPSVILMVHLIKKGELTLSLKSITVPKRFRKILINFSLVSYINTLATMLVISLDAMMVGAYLGLSATGIYTTIIYLTSAMNMPYRAVIRVSTPLVAKYWKEKNMVQLNELYQKSSSVGLFIGLFGFSAVYLPIRELFSFIDKPEYLQGISVFAILMVGRILDMYAGLNGTIFSTSRKFKYDLIFTVFLCVLVFVLNLFFIPKWGINGAAISTSIAYVGYNVLRCWYIYYLYKLQPFRWRQLKLMALFAVFFTSSLFLFELPFFTEIPRIVSILIKEIFLMLGFALPVYVFNLEPEIVSYAKNFLQKWSVKFGLKKS